MKIHGLLALMTILGAVSAPAAEFLPDTVLPATLQSEIKATIANHCGKAIFPKETGTTVKTEETATRYTTTFEASYEFDGIHPVKTYLTVESVAYAHPDSRGELFDVTAYDADSDVCVKSPTGITYLPETALPVDLQTMIDAAVAAQCRFAIRPIEVNTTVEMVRDDQMHDYYYTTTLYAEFNDLPGGVSIIVKSQDLDISIPGGRYSVTEITGTSQACGPTR